MRFDGGRGLKPCFHRTSDTALSYESIASEKQSHFLTGLENPRVGCGVRMSESPPLRVTPIGTRQ
jgi:hypothetical protein